MSKTARKGWAGRDTPIEEVALVETDTATVEMHYHAFKSRSGPLQIFAAPKRSPGPCGLRECGCNPYHGHIVARSIDDARKLRDAIDKLIAYAEARA